MSYNVYDGILCIGGATMRIQDKDYFHGAALTQIVEDPSFTALNKVDAKYGHYLINSNIRLLMKHCSSEKSPWVYTLNPADARIIQRDIDAGSSTFLCLICGLVSICILNQNQILELVSLNPSSPQTIRIEQKKGGSLWAYGSKGDCEKSIPHNAFPGCLFL